MAHPQGPSDPGATGVGADAPATSHRSPQSTGEELSRTAAETTAELRQQAREVTEEVKHEAYEAVEEAKEQARASAARQKDAAAQRMGGFAHALKTASDDLRQQGQAFAAEYVQQAAGGLERASDAMRERDLDDLIGSVEDFARRQPVAFLGGAVVAGFGLARLMKSSADRRRSTVAGSGSHQEVRHDAHR
jgi:hypothetical protein